MNNYTNYGAYSGGYNAQPDPVAAQLEKRKAEKHGLFVNASKLGALLIIYEILTYAINYVYFYVLFFIKSGEINFDIEALRAYYKSHPSLSGSSFYSMLGNLVIVVSSMAILLAIAHFAMKIDLMPMLRPKAEHIKTGAKWFPLSMSMNIIVSIVISMITAIVTAAGITVPEQDFSISDPSTGALVMQFLYVVLLGPVCEELLYRGVIVSLLKPYGKGLAVFFSAFIFGAMHGNIAQFASAFAGGLVFAAIAVKFDSIVPSIVIHIMNNTVASIFDFADVLDIDEYYSNHIYYAIFFVVIIIGFYIIFTKVSEIKPTEEKLFNLTSSQRYKAVFLNVFVFVYLLILLLQYVSSFISANS